MNKRYYVKTRKRRRKAKTRFYVIIAAIVIALAVGIFFIVQSTGKDHGSTEEPIDDVKMTDPPNEVVDNVIPEPDPEEPTETPGPAPKATLSPDLKPHYIDKTNPENFGFETKIMVGGEEVDSWKSDSDISFGLGEDYTELEGVITFRGNNYRDTPSYGYANLTKGSETLTEINKKTTGSTGRWGGSGWTGQPLVVKWTGQTLKNMEGQFIDDKFKGKEELVEVIIPSLDGYIYFMELSTGDKTRDPIFSGGPVKGTASLDPRGWPILYVGQGLNESGATNTCADMYFRAFDLVSHEMIMKVGASSSDPFALRNWQAYDSSPLVDAESDTLIWPGENGIIYICKLNSSYDSQTGKVTMDMDPQKAKYRYTSTRNKAAENGKGRYGIENSIVTWRNYMIFTDNAGLLQCVDLNTLELVYANDVSDDSDVSMVLEEDPSAATFYLYTGCEYDENVRPLGNTGPAYARKIDGLTGKILWEQKFDVFATESVDGGILASPVLGREGTSMAGLIIYNVTYEAKPGASSVNDSTSRLVALDKLTGEIVWDYDMDITGWSPSSPVPVYTEDGQGYIVQCDRDGEVALIRVDGQTAQEAAKISLKVVQDGEVKEQNNFEATPVVYENMIVVGSRSNHFFYIKMS